MRLLVLLNGAPASGTSTVAAALVDRRPPSLNLDPTVRSVENLVSRYELGRA